MRVEDVEVLRYFEPFQTALFGIISYHGNGYIRGKADRYFPRTTSFLYTFLIV
jgi:hypothetical protein